jgi:RHS repeat-associated protein
VSTNTLPTIVLQSPNAAVSVLAPVTLDLEALASDAEGSLSKVEFFANSILIGTVNTVPSGTVARFRWVGNDPGTFQITAKATDSNGASVITAGIAVTVTGLPLKVSQNKWSYEYDAIGNVTKITDPLSKVTVISYDALNRRDTVTQPQATPADASPITKFGYDGLDQLVSVTDPRNLITTYIRDGLGNLNSQSSPDTGLTSNSLFDAAGNLKTSTDARGKATNYEYDALNRVTKVSWATGTPTVIEYDGGTSPQANDIGRLTKLTDESGNTRYYYDLPGRVVKKEQTTIATQGGSAKLFTVFYAYADNTAPAGSIGRLIGITYPSGAKVVMGYDGAGNIQTVSLNPVNSNGVGTNAAISLPIASALQYFPFGSSGSMAKTWVWGDANAATPRTTSRSFDAVGRMTSYDLGQASNNDLKRTVSYDALGRIEQFSQSTAATVNTPTIDQTFTYDGLDRLTNQTIANTSYGWGYDIGGNRTSNTIGGTNFTNTVSPSSNKLLNITGPTPAKTNLFDNAGNLTTDGTIGYVYSDRGRMASSTKANLTTSYKYNGAGQRVSKAGPTTIVDTGTNYYVYDEVGQMLGEYDANAKPIQETVYLGEMPLAVIKQETNNTTNQIDTKLNYIHTDHLNTPRVITRAEDGKVVWKWAGEAFGTTPAQENPSNLTQFVYNPRFPGQMYDRETNLHYNYFRDYDPQVGRYVQSDPIGLGGGTNTFTYALNRPVSFIDRLGLDVFLCMQPAFGISFNPVDLHWIKTDTAEDGMGGLKGKEPGNESGAMPGDKVGVIDHSGRSHKPGAFCKKIENVDDKKVNEQLKLGRDLGRWGPTNQCQSFAREVLGNARVASPSLTPFDNPSIWGF